MSITRLLFLAGLLAVGACGRGPLAICDIDQETQWTTCTSETSTLTSEASTLPTVLPVPYDE
jgi:hypothetical protein